MHTDTRYWVARRREEDRVLRLQAARDSVRALEMDLGTRLGLTPYTHRWAEWSYDWHEAGCPVDGTTGDRPGPWGHA